MRRSTTHRRRLSRHRVGLYRESPLKVTRTVLCTIGPHAKKRSRRAQHAHATRDSAARARTAGTHTGLYATPPRGGATRGARARLAPSGARLPPPPPPPPPPPSSSPGGGWSRPEGPDGARRVRPAAAPAARPASLRARPSAGCAWRERFAGALNWPCVAAPCTSRSPAGPGGTDALGACRQPAGASRQWRRGACTGRAGFDEFERTAPAGNGRGGREPVGSSGFSLLGVRLGNRVGCRPAREWLKSGRKPVDAAVTNRSTGGHFWRSQLS